MNSSMQHHVATDRQISVGSCNPLVNLVPLRACEWGHGTCVLHSHSFRDLPNQQPRRGLFMKSAIVLKVAAVAVVAALAGCQDLKPLQADVADLKSQVAKLQSDVANTKSSADQANSTAQAANRAAGGARGAAGRAGAAARAGRAAGGAADE